MILRGLGQDIPLNGSMTLIYWAGVVGVVAYMAQQLALSFKYIEDAAEIGAPQWMEWRAAFGLMVSLVWIFIVLFRVIKQLRVAMRDSRRAALVVSLLGFALK